MKPFLAWLRARLQARLAYRGDLAFALLGDLVLALVGLVAAGTLFHHVSDLRGYDLHDVLMSWGLAEASLGLFWTLFGGLYAFNRQYLLDGELDRVLLRPVHPYLQVLLDHVNPGALALVALGLGVFGWGAAGAGVSWTVLQIVLLPVYPLAGALVIAGVLTATASLGFWFRHPGSAVGLVGQFTGFAHWPVAVLPGPFRALVLTALPFAFAGFVPATLFMERSAWIPWALAQPIVGASAFAAGYALWRLSLPRYTSAGH